MNNSRGEGSNIGHTGYQVVPRRLKGMEKRQARAITWATKRAWVQKFTLDKKNLWLERKFFKGNNHPLFRSLEKKIHESSCEVAANLEYHLETFLNNVA